MAKGRKTGGRVKGSLNKVTAEVKTLARQYAPEAFEILVKIARSAESADAARVAAVKEILDRAYGKSVQALANDAENPLFPTSIEIKIVGA